MAKSLGCTRTLNDGIVMPLFGYGTGFGGLVDVTPEEYRKLNEERSRVAILYALQHGYTLVDTAEKYLSEDLVAEAIKKSGLQREDVFVVSKSWMDRRGRESTIAGVQESLKNLNTTYIDLYMIHSPHNGKLVETYSTLHDLKQQGLIRSVGVSNFGVSHLEGLIQSGLPPPSVNQIELHPFQRFEDIVEFCQEKGIAVMGYCPLARGKELDNSTILELSKRYGKTPGQVMIRWSVQKGYITIPKSLRPERIIENSQVFDWELSQKDLDLLDTMPRHGVTWDPTTLPWID